MSAPRLAILVGSSEEARAALRAGADFVLAPARRERPTFGVPERLQGPLPTRIYYAVSADETQSAEPRPVARLPEPGDLSPLRAEGVAAAFLDPERALLRAHSPEAIARFVADCRRAGLEAWLGGALELPDVPRLRPLGPDVLVLESLDGSAIRAARAMLGASSQAPRPVLTDTVIVRDFVVSIRVGAYRFERDRAQRVRFNLEIEVARPARRRPSLEDVYSYDIVLDAIRRMAEAGHVDLVETLAEDLAAQVLADGRVAAVRVRVEKLDLGPDAVGVEIRRGRDDLNG